MKNFIVPMDFSMESYNGLDLAVLFSKMRQINIQMVYVLTTSTDYKPSTVKEEHEFAEEQFEEIMKKYEPKLGNDSKIRYIIKKGKIYREIVNQVNSYKDAVVSASTHGASGFEELFVGSNALKIMSATDKPVFTVRSSPVPSTFNRIVLPIKMHVDTRQKVPVAAEIAELFGAEVHVVSISTRNNKRDLSRLESYNQQVVAYLKKRKMRTITKTLVGDSLPTLTSNYAEAVNADLVVMMSSSIDKWNVFLGSYAQQMLNRSRVPLLGITPREKHIPSGFSTLG